MIEEIMTARTVVFGCGNTLFGDDGFGPAVARRLKEITALPQGVAVEDVGTSIGDLLFDLALSPNGPESIWIVDAVRISGRRAGEVFELDLEDIPREKRADFSMHQFPAINLLQELRDKGGVEIRISPKPRRRPWRKPSASSGAGSFHSESVLLRCPAKGYGVTVHFSFRKVPLKPQPTEARMHRAADSGHAASSTH
jgi:coenzyme F420 hydrogenase subunit delta